MYRTGDEEIRAVERVLRSGQWFRYPFAPVEKHRGEATGLEAEWSSLLGAEYSCFTSSGTAALLCCYAGLGLGPGDEVIVPGYTFMATALAPLHLGAIPVIVDVDPSLTLDPAAVERAITPRTKAISPVHMNGLMADLDALQAIAAEHRLAIVEDACQCDGGRWHDGRRAGTIGDIGAFSFNFYKLISCGEGGMFTTSRSEVFERALMYHDAGLMFRPHAKEGRFRVGGDGGADYFAGINLRGNEIMAALMRVQLTRMDGIIEDLLRNRELVLGQLDDAVDHIPYNGGRGVGTGASIGLRFADEQAARAFAAAFRLEAGDNQLEAQLPIDSGRHVYANWEPFLERRGAHTESADPFLHPLNAAGPAYRADMLPATLDILASTALIAVDPDWDESDCDRVATAIRRAASRVSSTV